MKRYLVLFSLAFLMAVNLTGIGYMHSSSIHPQHDSELTKTPQLESELQPILPDADGHIHQAGIFVRSYDGTTSSCRPATPAEALALKRHDSKEDLHVISRIQPNLSGGLKIILRSTTQLDQYPQAKAAFTRAAATWEALIQTPITVIIDVDYGPNRFGQPYPDPRIIGSTDSQEVTATYSQVRSSLVAGASSQAETNLYNSLPASSVPTDLGSSTTIVAPTSVFRALGILNAVADPTTEQQQLGAPPSIGFNSAMNFDFDPSNGVDSTKLDFDTTAVHEIGHALGFTSTAGYRELDSQFPVAPSVWDLFRFRPGITSNTFIGTNRILSSGGTQVFFAGGPSVALSTGRPDGTGGDQEQASHWKADEQSGTYIGIMDPTLGNGERGRITDNDRMAIDSFGYRLQTGGIPDFTMAASAPVTVSAGNPATYTITITPANGFSGNVALTASGLPGGAAASFTPATVVGGTGTSTLRVTTATSTPAGTYSITVTGVSGSLAHTATASLTVQPACGDCPPDGTRTVTYSASPGTAIPDNNTTGITSTINVPDSLTITSVKCSVNITHSYRGDLKIDLVSPTGTTTNLKPASGSDSAANVIATYTPTAFNGQAAKGNWQLKVVDTAAADTGTLNSWSLTITGTTGGSGGPTGDFSISFSPTTASWTRGNSYVRTVTVTRTGGLTDPITLSYTASKTGLFTSVSASVNPLTTSSTSSVMTFRVSSSAPTGAASLTVIGTDSSGRQRTKVLNLTIF